MRPKIIVQALFAIMAHGAVAQYTGTASVTQGTGTTTTPSLYSCPGGRIPAMGSIMAFDATAWSVPAEVHFTDATFPFASDLHNPCTGATYPDAATALAALDGSDILVVDAGGELITAYLFADNYFELYINGMPVGKDNVPYTQFNSNIVRFRVNRPFTIAMLLVDWEEHLGLGSENSNGFLYHPGDGGVVAVFKDSTNAVVAMTNGDWRAQTFYTSPIIDLSCPQENGQLRLSNACSTADSNDGTPYHGLHWPRPAGWMDATFNDASWPAASTYSNATVGVNNKPAYTNFTDIFDDPAHDAVFIWSTNLILDNEVIVRHTVDAASSIRDESSPQTPILIRPNPAHEVFRLELGGGLKPSDVQCVLLQDALGQVVRRFDSFSGTVSVVGLTPGVYTVTIVHSSGRSTRTLVVE